jgi:hypothetical protein
MPMSTETGGNAPIHGAPPGCRVGWEGLDVLVLAPTPTHPIDAGNRRRIFFVNTALQRLGARITYVHYPAEGDWRERAPDGSIPAMAGQWYESHVVPVTRSLHEGAKGDDHTIDEWWDPAIGDMLRWLFRTHRFDVFIVNYAWLSKAFEFCPRDVLKILDTHDRFSGRRELLVSHGIAPEFFHTTVEQESIALDRADVVWAIKSQETAFFRTITNRPVFDMPHVEPIAEQLRHTPRGRVLRFGIVGAANNINLKNIRAFLAEADAYIRRTLLPCEFVIGGSICDLLGDVRRPWVRQLGRLKDMSEFYAAVDVVLAPVTFSTGLKIKVGEALCQGKAIVALAHAFEGYRALHPFHTLASVAEMLRACRRIVNDPGLIDELEQASLRSVVQAQANVARTLEDSIAVRWRIERGICIVVDAADVHPGSLVVDHVRETARYLGHLGPVVVFVQGANQVPDREALQALSQMGTLVTTPELYAALGPEAARLGSGLMRVRTLRQVLHDPHYAFWFASSPGAWPTPAKPWSGRAYVACDSVLLSSAPGTLVELLLRLRASFTEVVALSRRDTLGVARPELASWSHRVPVLWRGDHSLIVSALRAGDGEHIVVLANDASDPLLALVVSLALRLSSRPVKVVLPDVVFRANGAEAAVTALGADRADQTRLLVVPATRCFATGGAWLVLVVASDPALEAARDAFELGGVPMADLWATTALPAHGTWMQPAGALGLFESVLLVEELLTHPGAIGELRARRYARYSRVNDAGWAWIWSEVSELVRKGLLTEDNPANARSVGVALA